MFPKPLPLNVSLPLSSLSGPPPSCTGATGAPHLLHRVYTASPPPPFTVHLATRGRVSNHVMSLCLRPSQASHCPQDQANPCAGVQCLLAPSQTTLRLLPCTPGHPPAFSTPRSLRFVLLHGFRVVFTGREVLPASWHLPRRSFPVQPDSVESL